MRDKLFEAMSRLENGKIVCGSIYFLLREMKINGLHNAVPPMEMKTLLGHSIIECRSSLPPHTVLLYTSRDILIAAFQLPTEYTVHDLGKQLK